VPYNLSKQRVPVDFILWKGITHDMDYNFKEKRIFLEDEAEKKNLELFLNNEGINLDKNLEYTVGIYESGKLAATGSFFKNTLRCLAVSFEYQGSGLMNKVVSHLMNEQYQRGYTHIFVYTKCYAAKFFSDIGFYEITRIDGLVVFMENKLNGIQRFTDELSKSRVNGKAAAAIVMNANPFTLGHQYLVEKASCENDVVHLFIVSEEASVIPFSVRYELIRQGTSHLKNVILHETGSYIISSSTFPSYFIKDDESVVSAHANLDLNIFKKYIIPALGIKRRYVGEEPYCEVTKKYNDIMKESLEKDGIECVVVPRLKIQGKAVSASEVRKCIRENRIEEIKNLVPETTYKYFKSEEAKTLINKIINNKNRH